MIRPWLIVAVLACSGCADPPTAPDAQVQISAIMKGYRAAREVEKAQCHVESPACQRARRYGYAVEDAYVVANSERTNESIVAARTAMLKHSSVVQAPL